MLCQLVQLSETLLNTLLLCERGHCIQLGGLCREKFSDVLDQSLEGPEKPGKSHFEATERIRLCLRGEQEESR